jgi:hypothetical protein
MAAVDENPYRPPKPAVQQPRPFRLRSWLKGLGWLALWFLVGMNLFYLVQWIAPQLGVPL